MAVPIERALEVLKPGAQWSCRGTYDTLNWLDSSQTKPTEDEVNANLTELNNALPMKLLREERDRRIRKSDWMGNSDVTMADAWKTYRQALRDLPASSTPKLNSNNELDLASVPSPPAP